MADDVARAVGAGSGSPIMIGGKECIPRPLNIRELTEVERECLRQYRRDYVDSFRDTVDFLPEEERTAYIREKSEKAAGIGLNDIPPKFVFDPSKLDSSDSLRDWLIEMGVDDSLLEKPITIRRLIATALDTGALSEDRYFELTGKPAKKFRVGYVNWWITGTFEGQVTMVWMSLRHSGVTKSEVEAKYLKDRSWLADLAREVESITAPSLGNGSDSP